MISNMKTTDGLYGVWRSKTQRDLEITSMLQEVPREPASNFKSRCQRHVKSELKKKYGSIWITLVWIGIRIVVMLLIDRYLARTSNES